MKKFFGYLFLAFGMAFALSYFQNSSVNALDGSYDDAIMGQSSHIDQDENKIEDAKEENSYSLRTMIQNGWFYQGNKKCFCDNDGRVIGENVKKVIDVSQYNGHIDWSKVSKTDVDGVIIRIVSHKGGYYHIDEQFENNLNGCRKYNIPFGIYIYDYSNNVTDADNEATMILNYLSKYKISPSELSYPVYLDMERRGWYEEYGYKYYYDDNGELLKGLQEIDGNTYYFYSYDGHMAYSSWYDEDTITDNGLIVTVNKSGIVTNYANIVVGDWTHYRDKWYYYDADMNPYIGVKTINGVEYYFNYGQLAEYLDKVVTSGDTLAYVRDGKVIEKAKFKDNELIYLNGNCYYYYLNDAGYYYPYDGEYTVDGKSLYFIYGMLQTSDSDEILTDYRNDYLYAYNNKGEIVDKVKRVAGWNEIGNDWYYVSSEMNFVDGIYTVNGKEYYFENGRLIKSSNGISVVSSYRDENDKIVTYVIAYNSEGVVVEKKKAVANTWIQLRGKWYYYDKNLNEADGKMTTGWLEENDSWYYLDKDGQKNNWLVNIKW